MRVGLFEVVQYMGNPSVLPFAPEGWSVTNGNARLGDSVVVYTDHYSESYYVVKPSDYVFSEDGIFRAVMSCPIYEGLFLEDN